MIKVCTICNATYPDDAQYCNICREESLTAVTIQVPSEKAPVREDRAALVITSVIWLTGLAFFLGHHRPHSVFDLLAGWTFLFVLSFVVGLVLHNLRVFALFALIGMLFSGLYGVVKF